MNVRRQVCIKKQSSVVCESSPEYCRDAKRPSPMSLEKIVMPGREKPGDSARHFNGLDHERAQDDGRDNDEYFPPSNNSQPLVCAVRLSATCGGRFAR